MDGTMKHSDTPGYKYNQIPEDETSISQERLYLHTLNNNCCSTHIHGKRRAILQNSLILGSILLLILPLLLYTSWSEYVRTTSASVNVETSHSGRKILHCGNSVEEAQRLGCIFDPLSYLWLPPACYDFKSSKDFEAWLSDEKRIFGAWPFFKDTEGQERLENVTALSTYEDGDIRATQEEHIAHCIFMAMSARYALEEGADFRLNPVATVAHFEHCAAELLRLLSEGPNPIDRKQLTTRLHIGFGSC